MANPLQQLIAAFAQGGAPMPQVGMARGALDVNGNPLPGIMPQIGTSAVGPNSGNTPSPGAIDDALNAAAPVGGAQQTAAPGGGLGSMLQSLFMPKTTGRNVTIEWLRTRGTDEGTATLLASNRPALNKFLLEHSRGNSPKWSTETIYDQDGNERKILIDMNNPTQRIELGGSKSNLLTPAELAQKKEIAQAGASKVNQVVGQSDKFRDEFDKANAKLFNDLITGGYEAQRSGVQIDRLDELLSGVDTGLAASLKQAAGNFGIDVNGLDDIQAAQALINQLVPQQRPPGSGPMSDADLELFKQSLPRIINQPGGNRTIINTMRGIAKYTAEQGKIAQEVGAGRITAEEGMRRLNALENPLKDFGKTKTKTGGGDGDIRELIERYAD